MIGICFGIFKFNFHLKGEKKLSSQYLEYLAVYIFFTLLFQSFIIHYYILVPQTDINVNPHNTRMYFFFI